jgi:hypothetical protein
MGSIPSLAGHFCVSFDANNKGIPPGCTPEGKWTFSPHIPTVIREETFTKRCKPNAIIFDTQDVMGQVLVWLDVNDLISFSRVNTYFYAASKANLVWESQLQKLFPNLNYIPFDRCGFSFSQQVSIYHQRMKDELKPYQIQLEINNERIQELRGPTGFNGTINAAWLEFQKAGGDNALMDFRKQHCRHPYADQGNAISQLNLTYKNLNNELEKLAGSNFDGKTFRPDSMQALCQIAIQQIPNDFNNQYKFERTIERAKALRDRLPLPEDPFYSGITDKQFEEFYDVV